MPYAQCVGNVKLQGTGGVRVLKSLPLGLLQLQSSSTHSSCRLWVHGEGLILPLCHQHWVHPPAHDMDCGSLAGPWLGSGSG